MADSKRQALELAAVVKRVRELDVAAAHQEAALRTAGNALAEIEVQEERQTKQWTDDAARLEETNRALRETSLLLENTRGDAELLEGLSGMRTAYAHLKDRTVRLAASHTALTTARAEAQAADQAWHAGNARLAVLLAELEEQDRMVKSREEILNTVLEQRPLAH